LGAGQPHSTTSSPFSYLLLGRLSFIELTIRINRALQGDRRISDGRVAAFVR
jgi:hypothetical protein